MELRAVKTGRRAGEPAFLFRICPFRHFEVPGRCAWGAQQDRCGQQASGFRNGIHGADLLAGTAVDAGGGVHHVVLIAHGDGFDGAGHSAGATADTIITDNTCHKKHLQFSCQPHFSTFRGNCNRFSPPDALLRTANPPPGMDARTTGPGQPQVYSGRGTCYNPIRNIRIRRGEDAI